MAIDRFIVWKDQKPTPADIRTAVEDFFGSAGKVECRRDTIFVTLPGTPSNPFDRLMGTPPRGHPRAERWIEVVLSATSAAVLTRMQDEYTNALADGLAAAMERFWRADWKNRE